MAQSQPDADTRRLFENLCKARLEIIVVQLGRTDLGSDGTYEDLRWWVRIDVAIREMLQTNPVLWEVSQAELVHHYNQLCEDNADSS